MRILFIRSNAVNPDSRVEKEVSSLIKNGHKVSVLAWDRNDDYSEKISKLKLPNGNAMIIRCGIKATFGGGIKANLFPLLKFQKKIILFILKHKNEFDCIHACDFDTAFVSYRIAKMLKMRFTYDIFDYYVDAFNVPGILKNVIEKADRSIIEGANGVIICTEQRKAQIKGSNPRKLIVIHNTPSVDWLPKENSEKKSHNRIRIAYIGVFAENRFIPELLDYTANHKEYELHIGGFGCLEKTVKQYANKYKNIVYYGAVPYKKALEIENNCDVLTAIYDPSIPNHKYAAPNKFYESIMLGKPVIMVRNTGMSEIVEKYGIGYIMDYDKCSLNDCLNRVKTTQHTWKEKGTISKRVYSERFSWDIMEKRLAMYYKSMSK